MGEGEINDKGNSPVYRRNEYKGLINKGIDVMKPPWQYPQKEVNHG
jgi:hypothetical protein